MKNKNVLALIGLPVMIFCEQSDVQRVAALKVQQHAAAKTEQQPKRIPFTELLELTSEALMAPRDLGDIKVYHVNSKNFIIAHEGTLKLVQNHNLCHELRGITTEDLKKLLTEDNGYIKVQRKSDGEFALEAQFRLHGGGLLGAKLGFLAGKFIIHFVGHGTIAIISACTGPAALVTAASLEATFLPFIEGASNVVGLAGGVVGGVATGPV